MSRPFAYFLGAITVLFGLVLVLPGPAPAAESRVPVPQPAKAFKGKQCVEPVDIMRRQHGVFLLDQRNQTMKKGIRGGKYSLRDCVECHAVPDPAAGGERTVQPFCGACHEYTAFQIDCFQCHTTKPGKTQTTRALQGPLPPGHPPARMASARMASARGTSAPVASERIDRTLTLSDMVVADLLGPLKEGNACNATPRS